MAYAARRNPNRPPTHPGALLREDIIPAVKRSKSEIARLLGISRQHLHAILAEKKPVTPRSCRPAWYVVLRWPGDLDQDARSV